MYGSALLRLFVLWNEILDNFEKRRDEANTKKEQCNFVTGSPWGFQPPAAPARRRPAGQESLRSQCHQVKVGDYKGSIIIYNIQGNAK